MEADMDQFRMEMQEKINDYLDALRETGTVNMFGASPYIAEVFGVTQKEARDYLKRWMDTFAERNKND
jgi:hypothetical protein